ncbi:hypothetical protein [Sansalvadorimonas verongulae]|uniref:hypothetical protein n=1 Tax=Sansalvadorimonas verongulae TaxID=2172824 RepID=UPI0012BC93EF|nr:hypothetical protein [Sansalvadorimonas verongulae]MTI12558.1 hypothetical protein [Sansalvadorimonas verongulae]
MNTPCDDKEIELTLGKHLQIMGGADNLKTALDIFTQLRTRAAGGQVNTPCDDREIELALGIHHHVMGGADNLKTAQDIFVRLRTQAARGKANTPCEDKEIELCLAAIFIDTEAWEQFDGLQLDKQLYSGFDTFLCLSIRYFQELMSVEKILPEHLTLLGKAFNWAAFAVESSGGIDASCLSQLAHCFRFLSAWPQPGLQILGIEEKKAYEFKQTALLLFGLANKLEPHRQEMKKAELWRERERQLLAQMTA